MEKEAMNLEESPEVSGWVWREEREGENVELKQNLRNKQK